MFKQEPGFSEDVDEMVVDSDYVLAIGGSRKFFFNELREQDFLTFPVFHVLRARGKPIRITSSGINCTGILPADWHKIFGQDVPKEVRDKYHNPDDVLMDRTKWDIATFLYCPGRLLGKYKWDKITLEDSFLWADRTRRDGVGTLLFTDGPLNIDSSGITPFHVTPSAVVSALWDWITNGRHVYSSQAGYVGRFGVQPSKELRGLFPRLVKKLEDVYGERLAHRSYRNAFPEVFGKID